MRRTDALRECALVRSRRLSSACARIGLPGRPTQILSGPAGVGMAENKGCVF
jgi:hypothetical protein